MRLVRLEAFMREEGGGCCWRENQWKGKERSKEKRKEGKNKTQERKKDEGEKKRYERKHRIKEGKK